MLPTTPSIPVIDVAALRNPSAPLDAILSVAAEIDRACRKHGFFLIVNHGVDLALAASLDKTARELFALPEATKELVAMKHGGSAWRGWFPLHGELTSGIPDQKEGYYFGSDLPADHPKVLAKTPLHGKNIFPQEPAAFGGIVTEWIAQVAALGHDLMRGLALGLGMDQDWFAKNLTADPTLLFRIFRYPPTTAEGWGVGEHTDYGILTMLWQDSCGGLQVFTEDKWVEVEPVPNAFVCNIGDMLEKLTGGRYLSTPHRVRNASGRERLSFPLFFDPSWDVTVPSLPLEGSAPPARNRWDGKDVLAWSGTYGSYLTAKVAKCFPELFSVVGEGATAPRSGMY